MPSWPVVRITVEEYGQLTANGVFNEDDKFKLLEGWLAPKLPKDPLHDGTIDLLQGLLEANLLKGRHVRVQNTLVTADSVPEPDVIVARGARGKYRLEHPTARDVALVAEVADSSVSIDRQKAVIDARAEVPEYWIVNVNDWQLERVIGPHPDGSYAKVETLFATDASRFGGECMLALREFFLWSVVHPNRFIRI